MRQKPEIRDRHVLEPVVGGCALSILEETGQVVEDCESFVRRYCRSFITNRRCLGRFPTRHLGLRLDWNVEGPPYVSFDSTDSCPNSL